MQSDDICMPYSTITAIPHQRNSVTFRPVINVNGMLEDSICAADARSKPSEIVSTDETIILRNDCPQNNPETIISAMPKTSPSNLLNMSQLGRETTPEPIHYEEFDTTVDIQDVETSRISQKPSSIRKKVFGSGRKSKARRILFNPLEKVSR